MTERRVKLRFFPVAVLCLALAGCQTWPPGRDSAESPSESAGDESPAGQQEAPAGTVGEAIGLLQEGKERRAERLLEKLTNERPDDVTAKLLLAQIRQPPEELLGTEFEEVEVRVGESLSVIAERSIGNGLLFYSLAKLNDVDIPRLLTPGQQLKIPKSTVSDRAGRAEASTQADAAAETDSSDDPNRAAQELAEEQRHSQAYSLLLAAARAGELNDSGRTTLARAAVELAREACREDDPERAGKYLRQASPWLGERSDQGDFARQRAHIDARVRLGEAEQFLARGDETAAFDTLMAVREQSLDLASTHGSRLTRLETALAEHYHDRALSAWRDQKVELSVELWERVVSINPDFEPAVRYLERARRAQTKLKSLEID